MIHLDYRDTRPIYAQIVDGYREQITGGKIIREGAVWYKGQNIKASVMKQNWYVIQNVNGRVVLGMNEAETSNITSPIHEEDVILVRKYKAETPAVTDKQVTVSVTVHEETWQLLQIMADGNHWSVGQVIDKLLEDAR